MFFAGPETVNEKRGSFAFSMLCLDPADPVVVPGSILDPVIRKDGCSGTGGHDWDLNAAQ